jgi:hypothetical protein
VPVGVEVFTGVSVLTEVFVTVSVGVDENVPVGVNGMGVGSEVAVAVGLAV